MRPALLAALVALSGCTTVQTLRERHHVAINDAGHDAAVTVELRDGRRLQAAALVVASDSVSWTDQRGARVARPLGDLKTLIVCQREPTAPRTALHFGLTLGAIGGILGVANGQNSCDDTSEGVYLCTTRPALGIVLGVAGFVVGLVPGLIVGSFGEGCTTYTVPSR